MLVAYNVCYMLHVVCCMLLYVGGHTISVLQCPGRTGPSVRCPHHGRLCGHRQD